MADVKVENEANVVASIAGTEVSYLVQDPTGTPTPGQVTKAVEKAYYNSAPTLTGTATIDRILPTVSSTADPTSLDWTGTKDVLEWTFTANRTITSSNIPTTVGVRKSIFASAASGGPWVPTFSSGTILGGTPSVPSGGGTVVITLETIGGGNFTVRQTLALSEIAPSTSTAIGVGSIELGHTSDTTIARSGAGAITVEGVQVLLSGAALGTPSSGNLSNCTAATESANGVVELATSAEINTGTDAVRPICPDQLAASDFGIVYVQFRSADFTSDLATGDGADYLHIPDALNGMNLVYVHARVITAGTTGTTDFQIANVTDAVDMLSTKLTIDSGETGSNTAATAAVIDTTKDDVATNDLLRLDIDALSTTKPKGYVVTLGFRKP